VNTPHSACAARACTYNSKRGPRRRGIRKDANIATMPTS
jgi:hypothetical protein